VTLELERRLEPLLRVRVGVRVRVRVRVRVGVRLRVRVRVGARVRVGVRLCGRGAGELVDAHVERGGEHELTCRGDVGEMWAR